jgi:putative spermidine/putrescine transport system permease protein
VAIQWYFPHKLPLTFGFRYWGEVFKPTSDAFASLGTSIVIAVITVLVSLLLAVPAGYALGRRLAPGRGLILFIILLPQAFPSVAIYLNIARVFLHDRAQRHDHRCRARACGAWSRHRGLDRGSGVCGRRCRARTRRPHIGASGLRTALTVTLPLAAPGLMAAAIFVFLESLDEFTGTYFVGVPDITTLPLMMFNASLAGNYQIATVTPLILLVPSVAFMLLIKRFLNTEMLATIG